MLNCLFNNLDMNDYRVDYADLMENDTGLSIEDIGNKEREKLFKRYYGACKDLNNKIHEKTNIKDFLTISGSKKRFVEINKKYRPIIAR